MFQLQINKFCALNLFFIFLTLGFFTIIRIKPNHYEWKIYPKFHVWISFWYFIYEFENVNALLNKLNVTHFGNPLKRDVSVIIIIWPCSFNYFCLFSHSIKIMFAFNYISNDVCLCCWIVCSIFIKFNLSEYNYY